MELLTGFWVCLSNCSTIDVTFGLVLSHRGRLCRHCCIIDLLVVAVSPRTFVLERTTGPFV